MAGCQWRLCPQRRDHARRGRNELWSAYAALLRAARSTGIDARLSHDAGRYLCNYLCWRALEAHRGADGPRLAAFVHVPLLARNTASSRKAPSDRLTLDHLVDAGEALLLQMVALARRK